MWKDVPGGESDGERLVSGSARDRSTSGGQELAATGPLVAGHSPLPGPVRAQYPASGPAPHRVLHRVVHQEDPPTDVRPDRDDPAVRLAGGNLRGLDEGVLPAVQLRLHGSGGRFTRQGTGGDHWRPPVPGAGGRADRPTSSASGRIIGCRRGNRSWRWRRGGSQRRAWRRPITWPLPRGWPSWLREATRSTRPSPRT